MSRAAALLPLLTLALASAASAQGVPSPPTRYGAEGAAPPAARGGLDTPQGYQAAPPRESEVAVVAWGETELRLHLRSLDGGSAPAPCTAPCALTLTPGRYVMEVQPRGGGPFTADESPQYFGVGPHVMQLSYDRRSGLRALGWVFFSMAATALSLTFPFGPIIGAIIGAPIAAALLIPWLPLALLRDSVHAQLTPVPLFRP